MEPLLLQMLHSSHTEQTFVIMITGAGSFKGIVSKVTDLAVELREEEGKRCWVVLEKIHAVKHE